MMTWPRPYSLGMLVALAGCFENPVENPTEGSTSLGPPGTSLGGSSTDSSASTGTSSSTSLVPAESTEAFIETPSTSEDSMDSTSATSSDVSSGTPTSADGSTGLETHGSTAGEVDRVYACTSEAWRASNANYRRRVYIEVDNAVTASPLSDFPVLVILDPAWFDYAAAQPGGTDLMFRSRNNTNLLSFDVDHWSRDGRSSIWVRLPRLPEISNDPTTGFWLYYGNLAPTDLEDAEATFPTFVSVHHLGGDLSDATGTADASAATRDPVLCTAEDGCEPRIGEASRFYQSDEHVVELENEPAFDLWTSLSISVWMRTESLTTTNGWMPIVTKGEDAWRLHQYDASGLPTLAVDCYIEGRCGDTFDQYGNFNAAQAGDPAVTSIRVDDGAWHHVAATLEFPPGNEWSPPERPLTARVYIDGEQVTERSFATPIEDFPEPEPAYIGDADRDGGFPLTIGAKHDTDTIRYYDGDLDEVRITGRALTADWIRAEYNIVTGDIVHIGEPERCE